MQPPITDNHSKTYIVLHIGQVNGQSYEPLFQMFWIVYEIIMCMCKYIW